MVSFTTDLGYEVELTSARIIIKDFKFTISGDLPTTSLRRGLLNLFTSRAFAHPGHNQGGEVTGELIGDFIIKWPSDDGRELGISTLITGTYSAVDFTFGHGSVDTLDLDDLP